MSLVYLVLCLLVSSVFSKEEASPGVQIRMSQAFIDQMKKEFVYQIDFLANQVARKPEDFSSNFSLGFIPLQVNVSDIEYGHMFYDEDGFNVNITDKVFENKVKIYLPIAEYWQVNFTYDVKVMGIPFRGRMEACLKEVYTFFDLSFDRDLKGNLALNFHNFKLNLWKSSFTVDTGNWVTSFFQNTAIKTNVILTDVLMNLVGGPLLNMLSKSVLKSVTNGYLYEFKMSYDKIQKVDQFAFDYLPSFKPVIGEGNLDLGFNAFLSLLSEECQVDQNEFVGLKDTQDWLQVVVSDRVVNCALEAFQNSDYSTYVFNRKNLMEHFDMDLSVTSLYVEKFLPQIQTYFGQETALNIEFSYRQAKVFFGEPGSDILFQVTLTFALFASSDNRFLVEVEVPIQGNLVNFDIENDKIHGNVDFLEVASGSNEYRSSIGFTSSDYEGFLEQVDVKLAEMKQNLVEDLQNGIPLPRGVFKHAFQPEFVNRHFILVFDYIYKTG